MIPQDSITHVEPTIESSTTIVTDSVVRHTTPRTPYQVLRTLPRDATPAQQDSAIQATFQPAEIRYSSQPDTLHLPGHGKGVKLTEVDIPIYYEKTFFAKSLDPADRTATLYGMPGDPVPYTLRTDNAMTSLLLASFVLTLLLLGSTHRFFFHQLKGFFYVPRTDDTFMPETSTELRAQFFLLAQTCLLMAILQFDYTQKFIGETFILESDYMLIGIYFLMFIGYFAIRSLLYSIVNNVFFDNKRNILWQKTLLLITSLEGVALFPLVLLMVFFNLSTQNVILYFTIVLVFTKILTFYKCYVIFFRRFGGFLQNILYLCTLEIIPIAAFWSLLVLTGNFYKINY